MQRHEGASVTVISRGRRSKHRRQRCPPRADSSAPSVPAVLTRGICVLTTANVEACCCTILMPLTALSSATRLCLRGVPVDRCSCGAAAGGRPAASRQRSECGVSARRWPIHSPNAAIRNATMKLNHMSHPTFGCSRQWCASESPALVPPCPAVVAWRERCQDLAGPLCRVALF